MLLASSAITELTTMIHMRFVMKKAHTSANAEEAAWLLPTTGNAIPEVMSKDGETDLTLAQPAELWDIATLLTEKLDDGPVD